MTKTVYESFRPVLEKGRKYQRHTKGTYIGLVACVIQDSPNKMLTFKQVGQWSRFNKKNTVKLCLNPCINQHCFLFTDYEEIGHVRHWRQERSRKQHQSLSVIQQVLCKGKLV